MRRELLTAWPAISERFGLHPWDVERLTQAELETYVKALG